MTTDQNAKPPEDQSGGFAVNICICSRFLPEGIIAYVDQICNMLPGLFSFSSSSAGRVGAGSFDIKAVVRLSGRAVAHRASDAKRTKVVA